MTVEVVQEGGDGAKLRCTQAETLLGEVRRLKECCQAMETQLHSMIKAPQQQPISYGKCLAGDLIPNAVEVKIDSDNDKVKNTGLLVALKEKLTMAIENLSTKTDHFNSVVYGQKSRHQTTSTSHEKDMDNILECIGVEVEDKEVVEELRKLAWSLNLISLVTERATKNEPRSNLKEKYLVAMSCVVMHEESRACAAELIEFGWAERVVDWMKEGLEDQRLQVAACSLSSELARRINRLADRKNDIVNQILVAMKKYRTRPQVQAKACEALFFFAFEEEKRTYIMKSDGAKYVLDAMEMHSGCANVVMRACGVLSRLAEDGASSLTLQFLGVVECISKAMEKHSDCEKTQTRALAALCSLSTHDSATLMNVGADELIFQALQTHLKIAAVQLHGCSALGRLASTPSIARTLIWMGAEDTLLTAMKSHPEVEVVQRTCLWSLNVFASSQASFDCKIEVTFEALQAILGAMKFHLTRRGIQVLAMKYFLKAAESDIAISNLMKAGVVPAVLDSMKRHLSVLEVQGCACSLLASLASNKSSRETLMKTGAVEQIFQTLWRHRTSTEAQKFTIKALAALSLVSGAVEAMKKVGVEKSLFSSVDYISPEVADFLFQLDG